MEQLLALYALPYDPHYPVICFDERPCFLIGDRVEPRSMQTGQVRKEHYAYTKHGSCALFAAIQPLTGFRLAQVHARRTKKEYTLFMQALAAAFPEALKIRVVQDNLNLTRQCLALRIPTQEALERAVLALVAERMAKQIKIDWQFSLETARNKLNAHYIKVHPGNQKFK